MHSGTRHRSCSSAPTLRRSRKYLLPTVEHGHEWFTAISEPTGGSDPARAIRTTATLENGEWVLNGRKMGPAAPTLRATALSTPGQGKVAEASRRSSFPPNRAGMSVRVVPVLRDHATTEIVFADCRIRAENLLGKVGEGFALAEQWLVRGRLQLTAQCIGVASKALEMAIDYSRDRETFGAPLASRQAIQFMLADSSVELTAARWLIWEAAWKHARGDLARHEAARAKLYGTETAFKVIDRVVQIFGGMGVAKEFNVEHWFRSVRISRIVDGASEIQKFIIARDLLAKTRPASRCGRMMSTDDPSAEALRDVRPPWAQLLTRDGTHASKQRGLAGESVAGRSPPFFSSDSRATGCARRLTAREQVFRFAMLLSVCFRCSPPLAVRQCRSSMPTAIQPHHGRRPARCGAGSSGDQVGRHRRGPRRVPRRSRGC